MLWSPLGAHPSRSLAPPAPSSFPLAGALSSDAARRAAAVKAGKNEEEIEEMLAASSAGKSGGGAFPTAPPAPPPRSAFTTPTLLHTPPSAPTPRPPLPPHTARCCGRPSALTPSLFSLAPPAPAPPFRHAGASKGRRYALLQDAAATGSAAAAAEAATLLTPVVWMSPVDAAAIAAGEGKTGADATKRAKELVDGEGAGYTITARPSSNGGLYLQCGKPANISKKVYGGQKWYQEALATLSKGREGWMEGTE
jgi:hypothetical protein